MRERGRVHTQRGEVGDRDRDRKREKTPDRYIRRDIKERARGGGGGVRV